MGLVDKLCALAEKRGILARRLRIPVPVHSYLMDVCKDQCMTHVGDVFRRFPGAMYSTVTGLQGQHDRSRTDAYGTPPVTVVSAPIAATTHPHPHPARPPSQQPSHATSNQRHSQALAPILVVVYPAQRTSGVWVMLNT